MHPTDGSTVLLVEGYFADGMQLFYLECPMRLDQYQHQGNPLQNSNLEEQLQFCAFVEKEILFK